MVSCVVDLISIEAARGDQAAVVVTSATVTGGSGARQSLRASLLWQIGAADCRALASLMVAYRGSPMVAAAAMAIRAAAERRSARFIMVG